MLIVLFLLATIFLAITTVVFWEDYNPILGIIAAISVVGFVIGFMAFGFSVLIAFTEHLGVEGKVAAYQKRYDSLVYQLENNLYDNDNDLGKKELYDEITAWNTDLAERKALQRDFWMGCFYPNIYDDFEFIELE